VDVDVDVVAFAFAFQRGLGFGSFFRVVPVGFRLGVHNVGNGLVLLSVVHQLSSQLLPLRGSHLIIVLACLARLAHI